MRSAGLVVIELTRMAAESLRDLWEHIWEYIKNEAANALMACEVVIIIALVIAEFTYWTWEWSDFGVQEIPRRPMPFLVICGHRILEPLAAFVIVFIVGAVSIRVIRTAVERVRAREARPDGSV